MYKHRNKSARTVGTAGTAEVVDFRQFLRRVDTYFTIVIIAGLNKQ